MNNYDQIIENHYNEVAKEFGLSELSTMSDKITREKETSAILANISAYYDKFLVGGDKEAVIVDVGCGNGYTLSRIQAAYPNARLFGVEYNDKLRGLAEDRFSDKSAEIVKGDIREENFISDIKANIVICQRVLINLLDEEHQKNALNNILETGKRDRKNIPTLLIFIEAFQGPLENLNRARDEFELEPIKQAYHNQYLKDDFFDSPGLDNSAVTLAGFQENFLSSHFYVSRVLHPGIIKSDNFKRNSEFVQFMSNTFKEPVGDYSPLKLKIFYHQL